jgi:sucrose phosphorylase
MILKDLENKMSKKTINSAVLKQLNSLISIRKKQPAFHPNATQFTLNLGEKIFALWRQCQNRNKVFLSCVI